jgi:hypothetical protein
MHWASLDRGGSVMHDILKQLNDRNPSDVQALDERGLKRFEALCETWAKIAEAELGRRKSLPRSSRERKN